MTAQKTNVCERTYRRRKLTLLFTHWAVQSLDWYTIYLLPIYVLVYDSLMLTALSRCLTDEFQGIHVELD